MSNQPNHIFDCIVVGAGVLGASIFFHLTRAGFKVALIEQNTIASGCTAWSGGVVRCFHQNSQLSDKAIYSWRYYKEFYQHTGQSCSFHTSGFLYFPNQANVDATKKETTHLAQLIPIKWLELDELTELFGHLTYPNKLGAVYEPESGYMSPVAVTNAWVKAGLEQGGYLFEKTAIQQWQLKEQGGANLHSSDVCFAAKNVILAVGASTPSLLEQLGIEHDMYAQVIQVDVRKPATSITNHPAFIDDELDLNGRPDPERDAIYIGHPTYQRVSTYNELTAPDAQHSALIERIGKTRWRWMEESSFIQSLRAADCYTSDGTGRVQPLDGRKGLYVASGFSGGGFKMAPWVGQHMVNLVANNI
ncbi:MAG: hypothetical protein CMF38_07870 [Legionellaceae bacterium]|nr:hypothetical protein [Legionellaceae bacterium]|tara:strand:- start:1657 stop:2739 length:1083 start_codon:yes stop_codon:yes gene_type:complete